MRENYEFPNARKNPFAGIFNGEYTVIVEHEGYKEVVRLDYNKTPPTREVLEVIPASQGAARQMREAIS